MRDLATQVGLRPAERLRVILGSALLVVLAVPLSGQVSGPAILIASGPTGVRSGARSEVRSEARSGQKAVSPGLIRADILDPCLGQRWQLATDPAHPGGPWRLVLVSSGLNSSDGMGRNAEVLRDRLVIHSGDRVTVVQRTPVLEARFDAVALGSAVAGQRLRVRLNTERSSAGNANGLILDVLATARGQVRWQPDEEASQ
jgi:hypothetical protein